VIKLFAGFAAGVLVMFLVHQKDWDESILEIKLKEQAVKIQTKGHVVSLKEIVDAMFADDSKAREAMMLLREFRQVYRFDDPMLVDQLAQLPPTHPVSRKLRILDDEARGPFTEQEYELSIKVASDTEVPAGTVAVCKASEIYRKNLLILNETKEKAVSAVAQRALSCPTTADVPNGAGKPGVIEVAVGKSFALQLFDSGSFHAVSKGYARTTCVEPVAVQPGIAAAADAAHPNI